jgi:nucleotide-binding universal stress UspA family protein
MIASSDRRVSLDDVLAKLAALPAPPDAQQLRGWMSQYPEFKASIITFVTDWIEMEAAKVPHEVTTEDVNLVVNRTMSRVQQLLDEGKRPDSIEDLAADIVAVGHDLDSFQRAVGIDRSMLTSLAERMVRPATIPLLLVTAMAEALRRSIEHVRGYLRLPPQPAAAYKARKRPEPKQVDFAFIVQHAELPEPDKARWLAEPPDPALQD